MSAMEREDLANPSTWKIEAKEDSLDLEGRCLAGLRASGIPATGVVLDNTHLKGGYICDTMRINILYEGDAAPDAPEGTKRRAAASAVAERPDTAILKIASPASADHDVAMRLRLYEREWHFYEHISHRVPIRVPKFLGSVKDVETGKITEGVLLEDLCVPGAILCPDLDDEALLTTVAHVAKLHAAFWNSPELASGSLGVKPHNAPWYQPGWGDDIAAYWPKFEAKWRTHDSRRQRELPDEAFAAGAAIMKSFGWIQDELSMKPHCFNHGDVKSANMFMMPNNVPAFIDWQYTAVGKGCQDILFLLVEGYEIDECRRLEPLVMRHYHASLVQRGVTDYSFEHLKRDWKLACMHFPFYVAMWFGTTPDENLVDPDFPRRFVPRAFDAILRNGAHLLVLDGPAAPAPAPESAAPKSAAALALELGETNAALERMTKQRDALLAALMTIKGALPPSL
ncbi:kinase-like domain-containing protein [Pelagophyceae sp. CCMP2097]|nr:kinase-like domain-containing protein [Pelagophyceae sp. CCMP2097]